MASSKRRSRGSPGPRGKAKQPPAVGRQPHGSPGSGGAAIGAGGYGAYGGEGEFGDAHEGRRADSVGTQPSQPRSGSTKGGASYGGRGTSGDYGFGARGDYGESQTGGDLPRRTKRRSGR